MDKDDFLNTMLAYEYHDNTPKFKQFQREKKRNREESSKKSYSIKEEDLASHRRNKHLYTRAAFGGPTNQTVARIKKFSQHCKDSNGKYWDHDTADFYFKKPAKESNAIETVQKEFNNDLCWKDRC